MPSRDGGADPAELARTLTELAEKSRNVAQQFMAKQAKSDGFQIPDPGVVGDAFVKLSQAMLADPGRLMQAQMQLWQQMGELWQRQMLRAGGEAAEPLVEPDSGDKRFKDEAWSEELVFDYVKQSYLVASRWIQDTVAEVDELDPATKSKVGVLHPPVRRRALAQQLRADQPHRAQARGRDQGREPAQGPAAAARRSRARQGRPQDLDDQRGGVPGRREHRGLTRAR